MILLPQCTWYGGIDMLTPFAACDLPDAACGRLEGWTGPSEQFLRYKQAMLSRVHIFSATMLSKNLRKHPIQT